jgi:hypothetical protein
MPNSFLSALGLSIGMIVLYLFIRIRHPYAERTREVVEAAFQGFLINAAIWTVLVLVASSLRESDVNLWKLVILILDTSFLCVSFVNWSLVGLPIVFAMYEHSNHRIDYRTHAVLGVCIVAFVLAVIYYHSLGVPLNPISIP